MNQETINKKWKRGETNLETGLHFWQYELKGTKEVWKTPEAYEDKCERVRLKRKEYNNSHVKENSQKRKEWRKANSDRDKLASARAYEKMKLDPDRLKAHREYSRVAADKWRKENIEKARKYAREYEARNKEKRNKKSREWGRKNKDKVKLFQIEFRKNNSGYHSEYTRNRCITNSLFALKLRVRGRTKKAFFNQGFKKHSKTGVMVGCSWEYLQAHIEQQFTEGMSWANRDQWHIDHIVPLASAKTEERLIELCHYTNLQPLWASENMSKGSKIILDYSLNKSDTTAIV